jgi:flavin-dependent thymidylate synthase
VTPVAVMSEVTAENVVPVLDHGFVALDGALASDLAVVNGARVSFNQESDEMTDRDAGLIRFLMRERHGSPFEHGYFRFVVKAPLFVVREHHRHRAGHCLPGSSKIWCESIGARSGRTLRKQRIDLLCQNWNRGITDSLGRTRLLPQCRSFSIRALDEETDQFYLGKPAAIYESGKKEVLSLGVGDNLHCTRDHRILTPEGWVAAGELRAGDSVLTSGTVYDKADLPIPPALRRGIGVWTSMMRSRLIEERDFCHLCGGTFWRDDLELDHVVPVVMNLRLALDPFNLRPACASCHRSKMAREQQYASRLGPRVSPVRETLSRDPVTVAEEMTYDIEMQDPHHNFVADRVIVHNSYNEWSGRYSKLEPEFYVPDFVRTQIGKPGAYSFEPVDEDTRELARREIEENARRAYDAYERMLEQGIAKEVARAVLPLSTYTKYYWSCNPRSLMHFCALRNHESAQYEIRQYAAAAESFLERLMPITHEAFVQNDRVAP